MLSFSYGYNHLVTAQYDRYKHCTLAVCMVIGNYILHIQSVIILKGREIKTYCLIPSPIPTYKILKLLHIELLCHISKRVSIPSCLPAQDWQERYGWSGGDTDTATIGTFLSMDLALFLQCILSYCDMQFILSQGMLISLSIFS